MALELDHLYKAQVIDEETFVRAKLVLAKEHRFEEKREQIKSNGGKMNG